MSVQTINKARRPLLPHPLPVAIAFWIALAVYVLMLPISGTIALRNLAFFVLVLLTAWEVAHHRTKLVFPLLAPWAIYALVALASLGYAVDTTYSSHEIKTEFIFPFAIMIVAASWIRSIESFKRLVWLLVAGNLLFIFGSGWSSFHPDSQRDVSGLRSFNTGVGDVASYISFVFPVLLALAFQLRKQMKPHMNGLLGLLVIANLVALYLSMNRQAWLSILASTLLMAVMAERGFWTRNRIAIAALTIAVLAIAATTQLQSRFNIGIGFDNIRLEKSVNIVKQDPRIKLWGFCLPRIVEHPWSGGGFGREALKLRYPEFTRAHTGPFWHCHNMVINKGIQMGLPGVAAFLILWIALGIAAYRGLRAHQMHPWAIVLLAMMVAVFLRNMTDDFFYRDHALLFWLFAGAFLGCLQQTSS